MSGGDIDTVKIELKNRSAWMLSEVDIPNTFLFLIEEKIIPVEGVPPAGGNRLRLRPKG